jgi:hypothetical protein
LNELLGFVRRFAPAFLEPSMLILAFKLLIAAWRFDLQYR